VLWNLTPDQSGLLPVAASRGGPVNIEWEVHGRGDIKLIVCYLSFDFLDHMSVKGYLFTLASILF